jgi:hypothetical protein
VADDLAAAAGLLRRLRRWNRKSWAAAAADGGTRADAAHATAQLLADLAAAAEGRPARPVPRLHHDLALPDQLAVMVIDVRRTADPATIRAAAAELATLRGALDLRE